MSLKPLFSLNQVASFFHLPSLPYDLQITNVGIDSRQTIPGSLFFALKGAQSDGHLFLQEVAAKGAIAAVVEKGYRPPSALSIPLIPVPNVLQALQDLARFFLKIWKPIVIGITGSVGKTTTKSFLKTLLSSTYTVAASPGNYNSKIGLPLSILNHYSRQAEALILEMGMTHPGDISSLISVAPPDIALLTGVELVHAQNFESIEEIAKAKAEIFFHPYTRIAILPYELRHLADRSISLRKVTFSQISEEAIFFLSKKTKGIEIWNQTNKISLGHLPFPGKHHKHNLLAAITAARCLGISWNQISLSLPKLELEEKRLEMIEKNGVFFVNDSYNACEISMKAALESLSDFPNSGRKLAVLGEMLELGKFSLASHQAVAEYALDCVEEILCFGKECLPIYERWKRAEKPVEIFFDWKSLVCKAKSWIQPGDLVLLKGSNSNQLWRLLEEF